MKISLTVTETLTLEPGQVYSAEITADAPPASQENAASADSSTESQENAIPQEETAVDGTPLNKTLPDAAGIAPDTSPDIASAAAANPDLASQNDASEAANTGNSPETFLEEVKDDIEKVVEKVENFFNPPADPHY